MSRRRITLVLGTAAGGLLAVGLGIGAALATPGVASADSSTDPFSWIGGMDLGDLSVPAQTSALDMQVSIDGTDLFPTAGNTATATSDMGDIAIAIGNGADASAGYGNGDFAFADGANSTADAGGGVVECEPLSCIPGLQVQDGNFDSAIVIGANSTAEAGGTQPLLFGGTDFDLAAAFGDMLHASATAGSNLVDIVP